MTERTVFLSWGPTIVCGLALWVQFASSASMAADDEKSVQAAQMASMKALGEEVTRAYAKPDAASSLPGIAPLVHFEAVNIGEPAGDRLGPARRLAAAIVAQDKPAPHLIVDVGSFTGELLEAFMQRFPDSHGQWTEPVTGNENNAKKRMERFGKNVDYVIGCPSRDISQGCVPKGVDVLLTSWLSIHQNLEGIRKFYKEAGEMLPSGGWLANLDHVSYGDSQWAHRVAGARDELAPAGINAVGEGPPVHHADYVTPTLENQLAAFKDAGFTDVQVVWRRLDTVLFMARKNQQTQRPQMMLHTDAWEDGARMPGKYTGLLPPSGVSPPLSWSTVPPGTQSFTLLMHDTEEAPNRISKMDATHWMLWNIPATATGLPEGVPEGAVLADGTQQVSQKSNGYRGPGPNPGANHHYVFELFALDIKLEVPAGVAADVVQTRRAIYDAMDGHVIGKASLVGRSALIPEPAPAPAR